ncbi:DUF7544 domain-containing protein [Sphaerisporangium perillae]|uniref:DUF7544 domain-containing protein n=1 Tax=Sphaerisporangium perillae TaxID=2935860 RepID=UPI00200E84BD|nr:hypothetical protein [Sphaerisporangium perillae]
MSDGHGSASSTPPGWAENQPPPYTTSGQAPWTSPSDADPPADRPPSDQVPPGQAPSSPSPGQAPPGGPSPGQGPSYGYPPPGQAPGHGHPPGHAPGQGPGQGPAPYGHAPPDGQVPPHGGPPQGGPQYPQQPYGPPSYGQQPYGQNPYGAPGYGRPYGFQPPPQALRPGIIPLRPLGLGDILDGTIKLIRSNPKATLGLSAIAAAIGTLPLAIGQAVYYRSIGGIMADPTAVQTGADVPMDGLIAQLGGALLSVVMQFFLVTVLTGMLTRVLGRAVFGGRITIGEAWRLTRSRLPALFGLALLTGLIALVPLAVAVGLIVALIAANAGGGVIVAAILILALAYIAYALFITTRFALAAAAVVLERRGVVEALRRSWQLVTGDFWRVFGILILTQVLASILGGILSVPVTFVSLIVSFGGQGSVAATVITAILFTIGGILSSMITYPIQAGVNGLLYTDRRMRAEAFDLVLQTAAIDQQRLGWVPTTADDLWHPSHAAGAAGTGATGSPAAAP